jgi:hypothetical protein
MLDWIPPRMPYLVVVGIGLWCLAALLWIPAMIFLSCQWMGAYLLTVGAMIMLGVGFCGIVVAHILERQSGKVRLWDEARAADADIDLD